MQADQSSSDTVSPAPPPPARLEPILELGRASERGTGPVAYREDRGGMREEAAYLGRSGVLSFTHLPAADRPPAGGVLVCSSLHADFLGNYRKEVLLARNMCQRGLAVERFQYRGTGNSGGLPEEVTFETLVDDARLALAQLRRRSGVAEIAFLGTRLGALVAAAVAADEGGPLGLWEPVTDARGYFREAFRARMIRELKERGEATRPSTDHIVEELRRTGAVDVLGYTIHQPLYDSVIDRTLAEEVGAKPRPVLLVQIGRTQELRGVYAAMVERWHQAGFLIETAVVAEDEAWWFVGEDWQPEERRDGTSNLVQATSDWFTTRLRNEVEG